MRYFSFHPAAPLDEFVDSFWIIAGDGTGRSQRILPAGTVEVVINLHEDEIGVCDALPDRYQRLSGAVVSGAYSRPFVCDARQHRCLMGVHFRPGGAFSFLGTPVTELSDRHVDLEDLWGPGAGRLRSRLCEAPTVRRQFRIMEQELFNRWQRSPGRHPAIGAALRLFGPSGTRSSTRDAARELGLSQRRFIQLFARNVGLTPKLLCRILRFQHARILAENARQDADWAGTAIASGYYDQSHLIRDFQDLSGLTPSEYLRQLPGPTLRWINGTPELAFPLRSISSNTPADRQFHNDR